MKGIVITAEHNTLRQTLRIQDFKEPTLRELQKAVGGYIEIVHPRGLCRPLCMVVNEDGLNLGLPINITGSVLYGTPGHGHPIVGNIVILKTEYDPVEMGEDLAGLSDEEAADLAASIRAHTGGRIRFEEGEPEA